MPRVPSYGGMQVAPTINPNGTLQPVNTEGDRVAMGGVQALQNASQGMSEYAQQAFEQANKTRVQEALNNLDAELFDGMYGQEGMMSRKGKAVVDTGKNESFTQEGMGMFDRIASHYADGLTPIQRKLYEEKVQGRRLSAEKDFTRHEAQQYNAYAIETEGVRAARAADNLAVNGYDNARLQESVAEMRDAYKKLGELQGWGADKTKYETDKAISSTLAGVIRGQLSQGNTEAALGLFRLGEKGLIRGSDAVGLRKTLETVIKAQDITNKANDVAYLVETSHDINYRFGDQIAKTEYTSPELERALSKAKNDRERRDAYAMEADRILAKAGGNTNKACQYVFMGDRVFEKDVVIASGQADAMAAAVMTDPNAGTQMTEDDIYRQVHKLHPDLSVDDKKAIAKKAKDQVYDQFVARDEARKTTVLELAKEIKANPAADINIDKMDSLPESMRANIRMFQDNMRNNPNYFPGKASDLRNVYRLQTMGRSELESELLLIDPNQHQQIRNLYEQVKSCNVKPGDTDERVVVKVFNNELANRGSTLADPSNKLEKERAYQVFRAQIEAATKENGNVPLTEKEVMAQMAMFKMPSVFKSSSHFFVDTEKQLDASSDGRSVLKGLAERLGYATSSMSLINLAQKLESKDPVVFGMVNQVGLPGLREIVGDKAYDYLIQTYGETKVAQNTNAALMLVVGKMYAGEKVEPKYEAELINYEE